MASHPALRVGMGKSFVFLLPCSRHQLCCLLHTCDNSGFFALLTSNSLILDGLDEQEPGESHPTHARKFFIRSDQPRSCLPLVGSCIPPDPASLPHTFGWETQGGGRYKPLQFSFWCFPGSSVLSPLHHISCFANSCRKAWGQSYAGAINYAAGSAPSWAVYLSFPRFLHLAGDGCHPSLPSSPQPSKGSSRARACTGQLCSQQLPRLPHGSKVCG